MLTLKHQMWWFRFAAVALLAIYLVASWTPFRLDPPRYSESDIEQSAGGWNVESPSLAVTDGPPDWLRSGIASETLVLELRIRPARSEHDGPARIFAISDFGDNSRDLWAHNLMIGQQDTDLVFRIRRPEADALGQPPFIARGALEPGQWTDVRLQLDTSVTLEVDGEVHIVSEMDGDWTDSWDPSFVLSLANTPSGGRPWLGEIGTAMLTLDDLRVDLLREESYVIPDRLWVLPSRLQEETDRAALHRIVVGAAHVTIGLALLVSGGYALPRWRLRTLFILIVLMSVAVNAGKIVVATRHPSAMTALLQSAGAGFGLFALHVFDLRSLDRYRH